MSVCARHRAAGTHWRAVAPSRAPVRRPAPTGCPPAAASTNAATPIATVIPCWTPTDTWPGATSSDRAGHRQVAPARPGRCDRGRRHPRRRAGSVGIASCRGPRPTLPSPGCSVGRRRKALDRCPGADAARDHTRSTPDRVAAWRGLPPPASGRWRLGQPRPSRNARSDRAPSARDSACSRLASLPHLSRLWWHSTPPLRDREPALQGERA